MSKEMIYRDDAIDALCDNCDHVEAVCPHYPCKQYIAIENLPSAQPEKRTNKRTETHACDLISRQYAIANYQHVCRRTSCKECPLHICDESRGFTDCELELFLHNVPSAQSETNCSEIPNNWIPCSERLPENNRQVLVYARSVHYALAKYDEMREADGTYKKQWVTFDAWKPFYTIKEVIAWMPLPDM